MKKTIRILGTITFLLAGAVVTAFGAQWTATGISELKNDITDGKKISADPKTDGDPSDDSSDDTLD